MSELPLASTDDPRLAFSIPPPRLLNLMVEDGGAEGGKVLLARPGLANFATVGPGPIWGVHYNSNAFNGDLFTISGTGVYRTTTAGAVVTTLAGTLASAPAYPTRSVASPESGQRAILSNGVLYVYNGSALTAVSTFADTGAALPSWGDITYLAGRFVLTEQYSQQFFWSAIEDATTIDQLSFASADAAPGFLLACAELGGQIALLATDHVEWWQPNSDITAPFVRGQGQGYARGTAANASVVVADNALFFIGDDRVVYRSGAVPQRISNRGVEERLRAAGGNLYLASCYNLLGDGHSWLVVNIPNVGTWAYDISTRTWAQWASAGVSGTEPAPITAGCWAGAFGLAAPFGGNYISDGPGLGGLGGSGSGAVYSTSIGSGRDLSPSGVPLPLVRTWSSWQTVESGRPRCDNLNVNAVVTLGSNPSPVLAMRYSDDQGKSWTAWKPRTAAPGGRLLWNRLGRMMSPGRLFSFATSDDVVLSVESASINEQFP